MIVNENNVKKLNNVLWTVILLTVAFNIIFLMRYNFEADSAFYVTLAQEQIRTKSLFPNGIYYSTGLFVLTPNLLVIPFLFVTDNLVLARQLAIFLIWIIMYLLLYKLFVTKKDNNKTGFIIASSLFSVLYINASVVSMHFYQGAYTGYLFFLLLFLNIINKIITEDGYTTKHYFYVVAVYVLANLGDLRNLLVWGVPAVPAYMLYVFLKTKCDCCTLRNLKNEKHFVLVLFLSSIVCFFISVALAKQFNTFGTTGSISLLLAKDFGKSLSSILIGLFNLFGNSYETALLSVGGVSRIINFLVAIIVNFLIPIIALKQYKNYNSESNRFLTLFLMSSSAINILIVFLTGTSITTDRYLITIYNNNILLTAVVLSHILYNYLKTGAIVAVFFILAYVFTTNFLFLNVQRDSLLTHNYGYFAEGVEGVYEFLENKRLAYGYATFENAEEYSILSNNSVRIRSVFFSNEKIYSYNWLTAKRFYDESNYVGHTFLMITEAQLKEHFPNGLKKLDLGEPITIYKYKNYNIFVYDYNIGKKIRRNAKLYHINQGGKSYMGINFDE